MARRKKARVGDNSPKKAENKDAKGALKRNRASPAAIVKLYGDLTQDKRTVIRGMFLGSFLDIKCEVLNNNLVDYVARSYDSSSRSFVFTARGVLPLTAESVHEVLGAPNGPDDVPYYEDHAIEAELVPDLFGTGNSRPKVSDVAKAIIACEVADDRFKRLWLIYIVSTCLAPTTDTKISNKCYPMLAYINRMEDLNLCKFVVDQLHMHFSKNKFRKGCLLYCMIRYVDSLDCDHVELELEDGPFRINVWNRVTVDAVACLDSNEQGPNCFGALKLKHQFREEYGLFGGVDAFVDWMKLNVDPECPLQTRAEAAKLVTKFSIGLNNMLSELVQGLTGLVPSALKRHATHGKRRINSGDVKGDSSDEDGDESDSSDENDADKFKLARRPASKGKETSVPASSPGVVLSQINLPSDSEGQGNELSPAQDDPPEHDDRTDEEDGETIRETASALANVLSHTRLSRPAVRRSAAELRTHNEVKKMVAIELGLSKDTCALPPEMRKKTIVSVFGRRSPRKSVPWRKTSDPSASNQGAELATDPTAQATGVSLNPASEPMVVSSEPATEVVDVARQPASEDVDVASKPDADETSDAMFLTPEASAATPARKTPKRKSSGPEQRHVKRLATRRSPRFTPVSQPRPDVDGTVERDGTSATTAIVLSPAARPSIGAGHDVAAASNAGEPSSSARTSEASTSAHGDDAVGGSLCRAIVLSPSVHLDPGPSTGSAAKPILLSSPSIRTEPLVSKLPWNMPGTSVVVPPEVKDLVAGLSDAIKRSGGLPLDGSKKMAETSRASLRSSSRIGRHPLDFTPPSFDLFLSPTPPALEADPIPVSVVPKDVSPIAFAIPRLSQAGEQQAIVEHFVWHASEKAKYFLFNPAADLDDETSLEIDQLDEALKGLVSKVQFAAEGEKSKTPKEKPHKVRVKRPSRFVCSPFDEAIQVTAEQEVVYDKLMTFTTKSKNSNIKTLKIIDYKTIFAEIQELADAVHPRGELSNNVAEVAVHFLQETNKVEDKVILSFLISHYMMTCNNLQMRIIANAFERSNKFALSCQDRIYFPVLEIVHKEAGGGHWYLLCLNLVAQRFEALDSIRGPGNICLEDHATRLMGKIKAAWTMYYHKSRVQIKDYELVVIDVPKQGNCKDCGFFMLKHIEMWDGQNMPQLLAADIPKVRKVMAHQWLSAEFNRCKDWEWHLNNNK